MEIGLKNLKQKLEEYQVTINENSKLIQSLYTEKQYDISDAKILCMISQKLMTNEKLSSEIDRLLKIIMNPKSKNMFTCETTKVNSQINPELDQNIWIENNITNQKTSIFCFIQEINNDLNIYQKWTDETNIYITS